MCYKMSMKNTLPAPFLIVSGASQLHPHAGERFCSVFGSPTSALDAPHWIISLIMIYTSTRHFTIDSLFFTGHHTIIISILFYNSFYNIKMVRDKFFNTHSIAVSFCSNFVRSSLILSMLSLSLFCFEVSCLRFSSAAAFWVLSSSINWFATVSSLLRCECCSSNSDLDNLANSDSNPRRMIWVV